MNELDPPFWCPWCEAVIGDEDGYNHAYTHRDLGPYAVDVEDLIAQYQGEWGLKHVLEREGLL